MGINIHVHAHEDEHVCAGVPRSGRYGRPPARCPGPARRTNRRRLMVAEGKVRACESLYACVHAHILVCARARVRACTCARARARVFLRV